MGNYNYAPIDNNEWISRLQSTIAHFKEHGVPMSQYSKPTRVIGMGTIPLVCIPCVIWSMFWRVVCCPVMCFNKGAGFVCSDNGCTGASDICISTCYTQINAPAKLGPLPSPHDITMVEEEAIGMALRELRTIFDIDQYSPMHYKLADACLGVVPYHAKAKIDGMLVKCRAKN